LYLTVFSLFLIGLYENSKFSDKFALNILSEKKILHGIPE